MDHGRTQPTKLWALAACLVFAINAPPARTHAQPAVDNNSGAMTMSVPMPVPAGPAGSTPSLALGYSSAVGNGNAGIGWSLPYSSIQVDTSWGVPEYWMEGEDYCDPEAFGGRLFLDGMELVPTRSTELFQAPGRGCLFQTRPDTFATVVPILSSACGEDGPSENEPTGFAVVQQDGDVWWYGDSGSRDSGCDDTYRVRVPNDLGEHTVRWLLHHVQDRDGNLVTYWPDRVAMPADPVEALRRPTIGAGDAGGCDGCLRAVTWAERLDRGGDYAFTPHPLTTQGVISGFSASTPYGNQNAGVTGAFDSFLHSPGDYYPRVQAHYYVAQVDWEARPDVRASWRSGGLVRSDRRVRQVSVAADASATRGGDGRVYIAAGQADRIGSWRLDYEQSSTGRSRLSRVWDLPGRYDPTAEYSSDGLPAQGATWDRAGDPSWSGLPNPWEFVWTDNAVLEADGTYVLPEFDATMTVPGAEAVPYLGASWQEGGFPTVSMRDMNGDGLADLVQDGPMLPSHAGIAQLQGTLLQRVSPFSDGLPNPDGVGQDEALDLDYAGTHQWVRWNTGDGFTEPEAGPVDPFALQAVGDWMHTSYRDCDGLPPFIDSPEICEASDGYLDALTEAAETTANELDVTFDEFGPYDFNAMLELSPLPMSILVPALLGVESEDEDAAQFLDMLSNNEIPVMEAAGDCALWWTGVESIAQRILAMPLPYATGQQRAAWCEHRSAAPYAEVGTTISQPFHPMTLANSGVWQDEGMPLTLDDLLSIEIVEPAEDAVASGTGRKREGGELTLWRRYATTKGTTGTLDGNIMRAADWIMTPWAFDPILKGLEPNTRTRWVDGYGRTSFQTRIYSQLVEEMRNGDLAPFGDGPLPFPEQEAEAVMATDPAMPADGEAMDEEEAEEFQQDAAAQMTEIMEGYGAPIGWDSFQTVQEGLVHDAVDMNGDGFPDRVLGGAGVLEADVAGFSGGALLSPWPGAPKDMASTNAHLPWFVALFDPETGEYGDIRAWELPLTDELLMGGPGTLPHPDPELGPSGDLRLWRDFHFNFLGVWEGNTPTSNALVSSSSSASIGSGGPSVGHSLTLGPISFSMGATAFGGTGGSPSATVSVGIGPVSFDLTGGGMSIGPITTDWQGNVARQNPATYIIYAITAAMQDWDIPYHLGVTPSPTGMSASFPGIGSDCIDCDPQLRKQRQGLHDLNGDGWPDLVIADNPRWHDDDGPEDVEWAVVLGTGDGFARDAVRWPGVDTDYITLHRTDTVVAELYQRRGHEVAGLRDLNGDGLPDFVYTGRANSDGTCQDPEQQMFPDVNTSAFDFIADAGTYDTDYTLCVQINHGAGFASPVDWFDGAHPATAGGSLAPGYITALSAEKTWTERFTLAADGYAVGIHGLRDWNGDGLLDYWRMMPRSSELHEARDPVIYLNDGTRFATDWITPGQRFGQFMLDATVLDDVSNDLTGARQERPNGPQGDEVWGAQVSLHVNRKHNEPGGAVVQTLFTDLNGDGALDWVQSLESAGGIRLYPLQSEVPDLLERVWSPSGSLELVEYSAAREFMDRPTFTPGLALADGTPMNDGYPDEAPAHSQVVTARTVHDGVGMSTRPAIRTEFSYGEPLYVHADRSLIEGFGLTHPTHRRRHLGWENIAVTDGRLTVFNKFGSNIKLAGLKRLARTMDSAGRLVSIDRTWWQGYDFEDSYELDQRLMSEFREHNWHFAPVRSHQQVFEGSSLDHLSSGSWTEYDVRNGLALCTKADPDGDGDVDRIDWQSYDVGLLGDGFLSAVARSGITLPSQQPQGDEPMCAPPRRQGKDGHSVPSQMQSGPDVLRTTDNRYFPSGRIQSSTTSDPHSGDNLTALTDWYPNGQPFWAGQANRQGQMRDGGWTLFDSTIGVHPVRTVAPPDLNGSPAVEFSSEASVCGFNASCPSAAHGRVSQSTDPNGLVQLTDYDSQGRVVSSRDSLELISGMQSTFEYARPRRLVGLLETPGGSSPQTLPGFVLKTVPFDDPDQGMRTTKTATWIDGLGRTFLERSSWIDGSGHSGDPGQRISGWGIYDAQGRVERSFWPCFSEEEWLTQADIASLTSSTYSLSACDEQPAQEFVSRDDRGRPRLQFRPDDGLVTTDYSLDTSFAQTGGAVATVTITDGPTGTLLSDVTSRTSPFEKQTERHNAETWIHAGLSGILPAGLRRDTPTLITNEGIDAAGRRTYVTRTGVPMGEATVFEYDGLDRVTRYADPDQGEYWFQYDDWGRLGYRSSVSRVLGIEDVATAWRYDDRGRPLLEESYEGSQAVNSGSPTAWWAFAYDRDPGSLGAPHANPTMTLGGAAGRLTSAEHWVASTPCGTGTSLDLSVDTRYDKRGRVTEQAQSLTDCEWVDLGVPTTMVSQHRYSNAGVRTWTSTPWDGEEVWTQLDGVGREQAVWSLTDNEILVEDVAYELHGRPTAVDFGNGTQQSWTYRTGMQQVGAVDSTTVLYAAGTGSQRTWFHRDYEWDSGGNLRWWSDPLTDATGAPDAEQWTCSYDGIGSLLGCSEKSMGSFDYFYDVLGSLISEDLSAGSLERHSAQYSRGRNPNMTGASSANTPLNAPVGRVLDVLPDGSTAPSMSLSYDGRGNLTEQRYHDGAWAAGYIGNGAEATTDGLTEMGGAPLPSEATRTFEWDARGRVSSISVEPAGYQAETVSRYIAGPSGNRVATRVTPHSSVGGGFVQSRWFGDLQTTEREDGGTDITKYYVLNGKRIAQKDIEIFSDGSGGDSETRWMAGDHLGSATVVTNQVGGFLSGTQYEPYGRVRAQWGPEADQDDYAFGGVELMFNGKERNRSAMGMSGGAYEFETYDYGARLYSPELGRFVSADTVTPDFTWEANAFAYVTNNPLTYVDPTGHNKEASNPQPRSEAEQAVLRERARQLTVQRNMAALAVVAMLQPYMINYGVIQPAKTAARPSDALKQSASWRRVLQQHRPRMGAATRRRLAQNATPGLLKALHNVKFRPPAVGKAGQALNKVSDLAGGMGVAKALKKTLWGRVGQVLTFGPALAVLAKSQHQLNQIPNEFRPGLDFYIPDALRGGGGSYPREAERMSPQDFSGVVDANGHLVMGVIDDGGPQRAGTTDPWRSHQGTCNPSVGGGSCIGRPD